ncbi:MAG: DUF4367 domain-containing protein [Anaerolineaceae bacterium]|nr:DUF4367 domain-containing protein [Anaerolineaceae bacterium]
MNDQFLRDYYKFPNQRSIRKVEDGLHLNRKKHKTNRMMLTLKPMTILILVTVLISALLLISPVVRAQVNEWIQQIGGVFILETNEYPGRGSPVQTLPYEQYSLNEVENELPFALGLPQWIPDDFKIISSVKVTRFDDIAISAYIDWKTPSDSIFSLIIQHRLDGENGVLVVGEWSVQERLVNGEPAALILGGWNADTQKWDDNLDVITLSWYHDSQLYTLQGINEDVSVDELIKIAESIR